MKRKYKPTLETFSSESGAVTQVFQATRVEIDRESGLHYVQLAEDDGVATIHSLLFCLPAGDGTDEPELYVEFNDQGNGMFGAQVGAVELYWDHLVVTPAPDVRLTPGRVCYDRDADPMLGPAWFPEHRLGRIVAPLTGDKHTMESLHQALKRVARYGAVYRRLDGVLGRPDN